jgi:hypothetical protein
MVNVVENSNDAQCVYGCPSIAGLQDHNKISQMLMKFSNCSFSCVMSPVSYRTAAVVAGRGWLKALLSIVQSNRPRLIIWFLNDLVFTV